MKLRIKYSTLLEYLVLLLIMIECNSMWLYIGTKPHLCSFVLSVIIFLTVILYLLSRRKRKRILVNEIIKKGTLVFVYLLFFYLINPMNILSVFKIFLLFLSAYILVNVNLDRLEDFISEISDLIFFVVCMSLAMWFLCSVLCIFVPTSNEYSLWSESYVNSYWGIYYNTNAYTFWGLEIPRNISIFAEAPMASYIFSIGFLIELCIKKKASWRSIIFAVTIFSTFSTTGIILVISAYFLFFVINKPGKVYVRILKYALIPFIFIISIIVISELYQVKIVSSSGSVRIDDFVAGYKAWKNNVIFGNGIGNTRIIKSFMSSIRMGNTGFSNSIMSILSDGGLYLFIPYVFAILYGILNCIKDRDYNELIFIIEFIFVFTITITHYTVITFVVFLFIYYSGVRRKKRLCTII